MGKAMEKYSTTKYRPASILLNVNATISNLNYDSNLKIIRINLQ
jgi:hypothetical protein